MMRRLMFGAAAVLMIASSADARDTGAAAGLFSTREVHHPWQVNWLAGSEPAALPVPARSPLVLAGVSGHAPTQPLHAAAIEHSDAYLLRAKIHKIASFASLPLFATELILGQSLYNETDSSAKKDAHIIVGAGIGTLFITNTVTGAWNLFGTEGRRDTEGRKLRLVHGLLMMAADVGFVATTMAAPDGEGGASSQDRSRHRNLAIASISTGTVGYLVMLFGNR